MMHNLLEVKMREINIYLNDRQIKQFHRFYEILIEWNKVMNLTGITEYEEIVEKHFVDSLSIIKFFEMKEINKIIDVGTGAGFPGIPLKIVFPHLEMVLLDSLKKRIRFLDSVINDLEITNIRTIHGRAEDFARKEEYREKFDVCVSRAVANLSTLTEYCLPFVRKGGIFISYKSGNIDEEVAESQKVIQLLGGRIGDVFKFQLPGTDIDRSFVKVEKEKNTSRKYPRKSGIPAKEPIR